jgi:hypothetical protein
MASADDSTMVASTRLARSALRSAPMSSRVTTTPAI